MSESRSSHGGRPHVVVDARMSRDSGIGTYIRNVVPGIVAARPDWTFTLIGRRADRESLPWMRAANVRFLASNARIYSLREQAELSLRVPRADVFWAPHYNVPLFWRQRLLVTVHDLAHLALPDIRANPAKRAYAQLVFGAVRRKATRIICDSEFTRREFQSRVGEPRGGMSVIHLGVAQWPADQLRGRPPHDRPYLLYVGNVKAHKNLVRLLGAFRSVASEIPHDLVIVGRREGMRSRDDRVGTLAASMDDRVRMTGEVSQATLAAWYGGAELVVFPSLYEGFGFPPLEAMAAGVPCVASSAGPMPEVCGDAVVYCDPADERDIAARIRQVLEDEPLRSKLITKGREHVAGFTWDKTIRRTLSELEACLGTQAGRVQV